MVRRTVHWFSVQSRRVKDVWQGGRDREERGRSIAAAAASSEVTIAPLGGRADGWNGQINRADGGVVASSPNCSTKGDDDDGDPDYQRGREGEKSLGFASTCTWSSLRFPIARIGEVAIYISLKGKYRNSIQISIPYY